MCESLCRLQDELDSGVHKDVDLAPDCVSKIRPRITCEFSRNCKRSTSKLEMKPLGNFPNSKVLAGLSEDFLNKRCNLGHRANHIIQLAKLVEKGDLNLVELEESTQAFDYASNETIRKKLKNLPGIGSFAAANILMCMGDYKTIPIDSETIQHLSEVNLIFVFSLNLNLNMNLNSSAAYMRLKELLCIIINIQVHGIKECKNSTMEKVKVYDVFAPYQCLAYWYEFDFPCTI